MDKIEVLIQDVLRGEAINDDCAGQVDYTLADQIDELAAKGVDSVVVGDYRPVLRKSVTYIVGAVIINEADEVLMIQEAKSSCAGTWYLPAGKLEPGEQFVEGVSREVKEETGLYFEPTSLLIVECAQGQWYRLMFVGKVVGGTLKTVAQADAESLQAAWIQDVSQLSLRQKDILPVIEKARNFYATLRQSGAGSWHPPILPAVKSHTSLKLRVVCVIRKRANNLLHVLVSERGVAHLPTTGINPLRSVHTALKKFIQKLFSSEPPDHRPHGVLSLEHDGQPTNLNDGLCITLLVVCRSALEDVSLQPWCTWLELNTPIAEQLIQRTKKNMALALKG